MFRLSRSATIRKVPDTQKLASLLFIYIYFFCVSEIYLMTADLDSRNMLRCTIKAYYTRSVWLCSVRQLTHY